MSVYSKLVESMVSTQGGTIKKSTLTTTQDVEKENNKAKDSEPAEKETKTSTPKTGMLQRAVDKVGHEKSIAGRLARRYAKTLPDTSKGADQIRYFSRGVDKIGAGTGKAVRKFLQTGKRIPKGGPLI